MHDPQVRRKFESPNDRFRDSPFVGTKLLGDRVIAQGLDSVFYPHPTDEVKVSSAAVCILATSLSTSGYLFLPYARLLLLFFFPGSSNPLLSNTFSCLSLLFFFTGGRFESPQLSANQPASGSETLFCHCHCHCRSCLVTACCFFFFSSCSSANLFDIVFGLRLPGAFVGRHHAQRHRSDWPVARPGL